MLTALKMRWVLPACLLLFPAWAGEIDWRAACAAARQQKIHFCHGDVPRDSRPDIAEALLLGATPARLRDGQWVLAIQPQRSSDPLVAVLLPAEFAPTSPASADRIPPPPKVEAHTKDPPPPPPPSPADSPEAVPPPPPPMEFAPSRPSEEWAALRSAFRQDPVLAGILLLSTVLFVSACGWALVQVLTEAGAALVAFFRQRRS